MSSIDSVSHSQAHKVFGRFKKRHGLNMKFES